MKLSYLLRPEKQKVAPPAGAWIETLLLKRLMWGFRRAPRGRVD